ncbi:MAG: hypothetical protein LC098_12295 [Burkholderiales bacterium]|nr:hypothetical protein [Burkholderiales bacterium]
MLRQMNPRKLKLALCLAIGLLALSACFFMGNHIMYLAMASARTYANQEAIQSALYRDLAIVAGLLVAFALCCVCFWRIVRRA